ncbi:undecaprenyl-diphosphate phosphatase [Candidatus Pantoea multigeneris]|uniref:Undecaprenyl-diphosphatase n=1 Tax=Candidatus Pantoea multigeneris TaxID=2608357 RepID=A0ABX0REU9_9GAMM|nr:undecaprenyl-diphosphate phosphatase [Pantoea multigeneris]NIF23885.1 undecaprenyl-diphosphate phosphatase [Pantoea multigeneris]
MTLSDVAILAVVQGLAELLPVSSSAHVIMAEKMLGLNPSAPDMTLLLVLLHTGTMFAVIVYFWRQWLATYFSSGAAFRRNVWLIIIATLATGITGGILLKLITHYYAANAPGFEIEQLFSNSKLISAGLLAAGILIILSARIKERQGGDMTSGRAAVVGVVQGLCLPFRGFSRSGATISTGLLVGMARSRAEEFSFALAVTLTPVVVAKEVYRVFAHQSGAGAVASGSATSGLLLPSLLGMVFSFAVGLLALRWLSRWLEQDRWHLFGGYCIAAAALVFWLG